MRYSDWEQRQMDAESGLRMDRELASKAAMTEKNDWQIPMPRDYLDVRYTSVDSQLVPPEMLMTWHAQIGSLRTQLEDVKAILKVAIDVFEGMNDDEITEDLLPCLREGLRTNGKTTEIKRPNYFRAAVRGEL